MRRHCFKLLAAAALLVLGASGCATVQKGSHQRVPIESRPEGAAVYINGDREGTTPMVIPLSRRMGHVVEVRKRGFDTERVLLYTVPNERDGAFIQFASDDYTGALNQLRPGEVSVELRPTLLPARPGADPEAEKARKLEEAREIRRSGGFSAADYEYVVRRIEAFYGAQSD